MKGERALLPFSETAKTDDAQVIILIIKRKRDLCLWGSWGGQWDTAENKGAAGWLFQCMDRDKRWDTDTRALTSKGFFNTIHPDSAWISKYSRSLGFTGAVRLYTMAPLLSASSSDAETRKMFVPILASCFTFSTYFYKKEFKKGQLSVQWNGNIKITSS